MCGVPRFRSLVLKLYKALCLDTGVTFSNVHRTYMSMQPGIHFY